MKQSNIIKYGKIANDVKGLAIFMERMKKNPNINKDLEYLNKIKMGLETILEEETKIVQRKRDDKFLSIGQLNEKILIKIINRTDNKTEEIKSKYIYKIRVFNKKLTEVKYKIKVKDLESAQKRNLGLSGIVLADNQQELKVLLRRYQMSKLLKMEDTKRIRWIKN